MKNIRGKKRQQKIFNIERHISHSSNFTLTEVIVIVLAFSVLASVITGYAVYLINGKNLLLDSTSQDIVDTYNKITDDYYKNVDKKGLSDSAIKGMFNYLGEKYSVYLDDENTEALNDKLNGSYKGIGIQIAKIDDCVKVTQVFDHTPAKKAGLRDNDILVKINDHKITKDEILDDLLELIKEQDSIYVEVLRDEKKHTFNIKLEELDYPVVSSKIFEYKDNKIGYIYLSSFSSYADKQFSSSLNELEKNGINSLIIDLRSNTGGFLNVVDKIASRFVKKGKILYSLEGNDDKKIVYDKTKESRDYEIVVLVNSLSASASEILASTLKESYGAIIVGTKTYGKGRVQATDLLSDKTMIKYTTAKWFTPSGESIDEVGIEPGVYVELTTDYAKNPSDETDDQLKSAINILNKDK